MIQIVILSGKGGTGKTSVAAALAHLASQEHGLILADADVDAANLELVLSPQRMEEHAFSGGRQAIIDRDSCTGCGYCAEVCRLDAIRRDGDVYIVEDIACEGCAACYYQCPVEAIRMEPRKAGAWFRSETRFGMLFHAHLYAGEENSGKLVTQVRQQANLWAGAHGQDLVLVDGPPGIGCPVIAACAGAQLALLVVEPTVSGIHDLERILATVRHFSVPANVVINKYDINPQSSDRIAAYCEREGIPILGRIRFDERMILSMVQGQPVTEYTSKGIAQELAQVWKSLSLELGQI